VQHTARCRGEGTSQFQGRGRYYSEGKGENAKELQGETNDGQRETDSQTEMGRDGQRWTEMDRRLDLGLQDAPRSTIYTRDQANAQKRRIVRWHQETVHK